MKIATKINDLNSQFLLPTNVQICHAATAGFLLDKYLLEEEV